MAHKQSTSKKINIAVLYGGLSAEREVSIQSGKQVVSSLKNLGHNVTEVDVDKDVSSKLIQVEPDVAFIALHGPQGEDGTIQGLLEILGIKYTGSGVLASAIGMDKCASKKIFISEGLPTPRFVQFYENDIDYSKIESLGWPVVIKPNCQGSSVGVSIVHNKDKLQEAFQSAFKHDSKVLAEEFIIGREIQCGIIGNKKLISLEPIEIISEKEFFDFEAKYDPSLAREIVPAEITKEEKTLVQELSIKAYKALDCRGFARVDTFLDDKGRVFVSEINTVPGLTVNSLFPKEAIASGLGFDEMIQKIVDLALE